MTLEQWATEYVALLYSPPNGLGQHVHPVHGASHYMLSKMCKEFGRENADDAIDAALKKRRDLHLGST